MTPLRVDGRQRLRHLLDHLQHALLRHAGADLRAQVAALEILHRDVGMVVGEALVVDAHHVRMLDARQQRVFLDEARQVLARPLAAGVQHLQHHGQAVLLAHGQVYLRHAARADLAR